MQRIKIPVGVEGENIVIKEDTVVVRKGETIDKNVADVLMKLGIEPIEISLNLLAMWEDGVVYPKELLFIPLEKYENDVRLAYQHAFNLSIEIGFVTKDNISFLLQKAYREAVSLAKEAGVITKETVGEMLSRAYAHMIAIKEKIPSAAMEAEKNDDQTNKEEG